MPNRKGGPQRKTRQIMTRSKSEKGRVMIRSIFQQFKAGDNVQLVANASEQGGRFPLRYYGKRGIVGGRRGRAYEVKIQDRDKAKTFIVKPIHLKRL